VDREYVGTVCHTGWSHVRLSHKPRYLEDAAEQLFLRVGCMGLVLSASLSCLKCAINRLSLEVFPGACTSILVVKMVTALLSATFKIECR
jgi:hypothetical protein